MNVSARFSLMVSAIFLLLPFRAMADEDKTNEAPVHPLLKQYQGKEPIPESLLKTYAAFAKAAKEGSVDSFFLPHAVTVSREPRPAKNQEFGQDVNLPFLKERFAPEILGFRKDPDDCYLVRTATSAIWFIETKSGAWKIYRYFDKPIE